MRWPICQEAPTRSARQAGQRRRAEARGESGARLWRPGGIGEGFRMDANRELLVVADDFGIGPETDRGILDCAAAGVITGTVLLVNSPHAEAAVERWRTQGKPLALGWHP